MSETDTSKIDDHQVYDFYLRMPFIPENAAQVSSDILQLNTPCLNKRVQVILRRKFLIHFLMLDSGISITMGKSDRTN